jgi:polyphosphate kinase
MDVQNKPHDRYFDRDISWLGFNGLILDKAGHPEVPLLERIKFLAIFSSNLDEFYRVRIPVIAALAKLEMSADDNLHHVKLIVEEQQQHYGQILADILPQLKASDICFVYNTPIPAPILDAVTSYFYSEILAFLTPVFLTEAAFYPENNQLYFAVILEDNNVAEVPAVLNIPSDNLPRFYYTQASGVQYVVFIDDIIRHHLELVFKSYTLKGSYSFKVTREANLDLKDEYPGDVAEQIEKQLSKRDFGQATRFLYQPNIPLRTLTVLIDLLDLAKSNITEGGFYHNLKDLMSFPVKDKALSYPAQPALPHPGISITSSLFDQIEAGDIMLHPPYQDFDNVLRFFNEAAINPQVKEIYVSLYRVASDSRIVNALISATKNRKKVNVVIELKARFDEANNLKWAKKLQKAGAQIIYSVIALKIHAKIALVKLQQGSRIKYLGLLGTGNLNESTAKVYTDHVLMTANPLLLRELELLFIFLMKREKPEKHQDLKFQYLLVSKFNLQQRFLEMIDREIDFARQGHPASIIIRLNNLEEKLLIEKLYEASNAGVKISLIIRSICCLKPQVEQMSKNITVKRIVGRYLEHGRIFIFNNNNQPEVYLGSADWMNRNIYHRIEVCYPVYNDQIKKQVMDIVMLQLNDKVQGAEVDQQLNNVSLPFSVGEIPSQQQIYNLLNQ